MPDPYIDSMQRWIDLSEIDYLSPFVKAWLAFNALYRSVYTHSQDRQIIEELKWKPNTVHSRLIPMLNGAKSGEDVEQFRSFISSLHTRLESYELYTGNGKEKERITFKQIYLKPNPLASKFGDRNGLHYRVEVINIEKMKTKKVVSKVMNKKGAPIFILNQEKYDLNELESCDDFIAKLNRIQKDYLMAVYREVNPRIVVDLTDFGSSEIQVGAYKFVCSPEDLFAGICEVIYLMRNTLFHGELVPCQRAAECYEPAYYIIRKFLDVCR